MRRREPPSIEPVRQRRSRAGIFLDFDGTLSDIVTRPEDARPRPEAPELLARLAKSYAIVAVISGRPAETLRRLIGTQGVELFGLYGLPSEPTAAVRAAIEEVERVASDVEGARVEDKGGSVAVHYRTTPNPEKAGLRLRNALEPIAWAHGLIVLPGRMVLELAPSDLPGKGAVLRREARARRLEACLYAGDDRADLGAFAALDQLRGEGVEAVKVAVRSTEAPEELIEAADLVVEGPAGLMALLENLA